MLRTCLPIFAAIGSTAGCGNSGSNVISDDLEHGAAHGKGQPPKPTSSPQSSPEITPSNVLWLLDSEPEMKKSCVAFANSPVPDVGRSISLKLPWIESITPRSFSCNVPPWASIVIVPE